MSAKYSSFSKQLSDSFQQKAIFETYFLDMAYFLCGDFKNIHKMFLFLAVSMVTEKQLISNDSDWWLQFSHTMPFFSYSFFDFLWQILPHGI